VRDLAGEPGGGLLLLLTVAPASSGEHTSVLRRAAAGTLSEIPGLRAVGSLASAADGSTLLTNDVGAPFPVRRLAPGALRPETILPGTYTSEIRRPGDPFAYDGAPATRFAGAFLSQVVGAPDGGIIATGQDEESRGLIVYVAPAHPTRLAAALEPRSGRATPDGYAVHYRVTRRARVRLAVLNRRGHEVASVGARASPGLNSISLRHRLPFATYTVALTVTSAERIARQAIRVFLGGTLADLGYARRLLVPDEVDVGGGCSNCDPEYVRVRFEGCRRIDQRRVDCRYSYPWGERPDERTCTVASAQLHLVGTLFVRRYACPKAPGIPSRPPLGSLRRVLPEQRNPGAPSGSG
jgi:hypothetical protein